MGGRPRAPARAARGGRDRCCRTRSRACSPSNPAAQTSAARAPAVARARRGGAGATPALAASALAALDDYGTAAVGYALGAVVGLAVIVALVDHGVVAFGWGLAVNGALAVGDPARGAGRDRGGVGRPRPVRSGAACCVLVEGVALPFALQGLYMIAYRFASGLGTGTADDVLLRLPDRLAARRRHGHLDRARLVGAADSRGADAGGRVAVTSSPSSWVSLCRSSPPRPGSSRSPGQPVAQAGARLELRRRHRRRARAARRLPRAVDGGLDRALGDVPAAVRARPGPLAAAARGRGARRRTCRSSGPARRRSGLGGIVAGHGRHDRGRARRAAAWRSARSLGLRARGRVAAAARAGSRRSRASGWPRSCPGDRRRPRSGSSLYCAVLAVWRPAGLVNAWGYLRRLRSEVPPWSPPSSSPGTAVTTRSRACARSPPADPGPDT